MNTTIRKIGNSEGLILPKELLDRVNLKAGDNVVVVQEGQELR
ncbi:AbrB/MazE/SpoVT family DNA-binding domain-containing protein, partial [Mesorhizobium sp. M8A.F.Ca.ET.213.01.1.1]